MKIAYLIDGSIIFSNKERKIKNVFTIDFSLTEENTNKIYIDNGKSLTLDIAKKLALSKNRCISSMPNMHNVKKIINNIFTKLKYDYLIIYTIHNKYSGTNNMIKQVVSTLPSKIHNKCDVFAAKSVLLESLKDFFQIYNAKFNKIEKYKEFYDKKINNLCTTTGILTDLSKASSSGRFTKLLSIMIIKKLKLKIGFYFGNSESRITFLKMSRGYRNVINKIYNYYSNLLKIDFNRILIYYTIYDEQTHKNIEKFFLEINPNLKFFYMRMPLIFLPILGQQYAFDILNDDLLKVYKKHV